MEHKCCYPNGLVVKPDSQHELDPCVYQDIEMHTNVTVIVSKCSRCGHIELSWIRTDETEDIDLSQNDGDLND